MATKTKTQALVAGEGSPLHRYMAVNRFLTLDNSLEGGTFCIRPVQVHGQVQARLKVAGHDRSFISRMNASYVRCKASSKDLALCQPNSVRRPTSKSLRGVPSSISRLN